MRRALFLHTMIAVLLIGTPVLTGCGGRSEAPPKAPRQVVTKRIPVQKPVTPPAAPKPEANDAPAKGPVDDPKQKAKAPAEEKPVPETITIALISPADQKIRTVDLTGLYNPEGRIDPFRPLFQEKPKSQAVPEASPEAPKKKRKKRIPMTPLEKIALSQMKLTAVILTENGNRALVEEASGKGYIVTPGTYIGTNAGRITRILHDRIIIKEEVENILGDISVRETELRLPKPPGE